MLLFIMFLVCSSCVFDIVKIDIECIHMFAKRLVLIARELSGRLSLKVVLRGHLPVDASYWSGLAVDRGYNNLLSLL